MGGEGIHTYTVQCFSARTRDGVCGDIAQRLDVSSANATHTLVGVHTKGLVSCGLDITSLRKSIRHT
jgi:hypothetical protein